MAAILRKLRGLAALLLAAAAGAAAPADPEASLPDAVEERPVGRPRGPNVAGAPFLRYAPETDWGFGAGALTWFHADEEARAAGRGSSVGLALQYTLREQACVGAQADLYLRGGTLHAAGVALDEEWPYALWAPGPASPGASEPYTPRTVRYEAAVSSLVVDAAGGKGLWLGARATGRDDRIVAMAPGGLIDGCRVAGCRGGTTSTLQATAAWDTRDHVFAPRRGLLLQARAGGAARALGSGFDFAEVEVDARAYGPGAGVRGSAFALQARLHATAGVVPFYLLPTFGGDRSLRGVLDGRYRDRASLVVQGEYDVPLGRRFALEVFGGAGQVAADPGAFGLGDFVPAAGAGLRVLLDPVDRVFFRVEHGVAERSSRWYVSIGQAI